MPQKTYKNIIIYTIIKTTSVGDAGSVGDGLAGDGGRGRSGRGVVDTRYGVSETGADAER